MGYDNHAPCCYDYIEECHYNQAGDNRLGFMKELGISWAMFAGGVIAIALVIVASVVLTKCSLDTQVSNEPFPKVRKKKLLYFFSLNSFLTV